MFEIQKYNCPLIRNGPGLILLLCFSISVVAQETQIHRIEIKGNKRTKTSYLERFISQKSGDAIDSLIIESDLRRLRTLAGVQNVSFQIETVDTGYALTYSFTERYTLLPVGDFGLTDNNFWIGVGAMESNLAGRGIYLYGFYRYNKNHTVHAIFRNPYIAGTKWGTELQIKRLPTLETTSDTVDLLNLFFDLSAAVKYEFRYENDLLAGLSYREQSYQYMNENNPSQADSSSSLRKSVVPFTNWELSRLDYHNYFVDGWRNNMHLEIAIPFSGSDKVIILFYDELRYYKRLGSRGNFASRILVGISNEDQTVFSPFTADSYYNFRGIGYRAAKGNTVGLINLEYRFSAYENRIGGIQTVIFSDSGFLTKNNQGNESFSLDNSFHSYAGLGLRFIYKRAYNAVLSVDYGFNLQNLREGGWVIGWGQYF